MTKEINAIITIAVRDLTKFIRDKPRIAATFVFPVIFVGALGGSLEANIGAIAGYNFLTFVFTGVLGQTLFQSTASGIISLIEDRENDFSQEIFISPISRYTIILGKIIGESLVAVVQGGGIVIFGIIIGVPLSISQLITLVPAVLVVCLLGGAFGILVLSNLSGQRAANQIFPFLIFPQFILAGVFNPIKRLPFYLEFLSKISPMRYAVDLVRGVYYNGQYEYGLTVLTGVRNNMVIISVMFFIFLFLGTKLFIRSEKNR